ncbi:MAG: hypothetical protein J6386_17690 [Candidatus Synoicihabitans palmerolidicus]|nr:hypothetical protein [Candidatus Synoicihabitans palmerolidicus]
MESTWSAQPMQQGADSETTRRISKMGRSLRSQLLISFGSLAITLLVFASKLQKIGADPTRTFANSFWDLTLVLAGVACAGFGVSCALRFRREFRALGQDTRQCLELLISNVDEEIRSIRRDGPPMFALYLVLMIFAKWQSIDAGFESRWEWGFIVAVASMLTVVGAVLRHRLRAFLVPRRAELENVRAQFTEAS